VPIVIPVVMPVYNRVDVVFERGEGPYLFDTAGRRYLDFTSGIAVNAFGHAHPYLIQALTDQAHKLWHTSNLFRVAGQERLGRRLADVTFADTAFFTNSGVEAWECSFKLIRKYQDAVGHPEKTRVITFEHNFHGRTSTAIAASDQPKMRKGFGPLLDSFDVVAFNNLNEVRNAVRAETAAICVEPVQGEGGIRPADEGFLQGLRDVCDEYGLLLFFDEIQCGMGRTGKLFAHDWYGVTPDVMCVAKGIGGGFPLGACLASEKAAVGMVPGTHGTTYGGNPLAMAVGNAALDLMLAPGFLDTVVERGETLRRKLGDLIARHPRVFAEVRGMGLMVGLKTVVDLPAVIAAARSNGLLGVPAVDNVMRLLPPLNITDDHINEAIECLDRTAKELAP
jgi:acetylornithine/N-succinyldiaminopimelate aminotransferase